MTTAPLDVLVLGSGVAGCSAALRLERRAAGSVTLLTKGSLGESATRWAQGGIAAVTSETEDSVELHLADTLRAGAGLCDEDATRILVEEGADRVFELVERGAILDRDELGEFERAREGGHSVARVVHAGGTATGAEVARALAQAVRASSVDLLEGWFALDLLVHDGRCMGVRARDPQGRHHEIAARHVVLATGGSGQLFDITTNPPESTGDGIAMALRAGVAVADTEFVQFHPTALAVRGHPRPLLSEALRGHGALLVDTRGERFVDELEPRDVVSRAIFRAMSEQGSDHVYLDARRLEDFAERFPSIAVFLDEARLDPRQDLLPVAPAAHYLCGGILTDLDGATALPGLWAIGETACTGVQGANRLASNSLLEGLVFGTRAGEAIAEGRDRPLVTGAIGALLDSGSQRGVPVRVLGPRPADLAAPAVGSLAVRDARSLLQRSMSAGAGVVRSKEGLLQLFPVLEAARALGENGESVEVLELANLAEVGLSVVANALFREESRGAHTRADFPATDDANFRCRLAHCGPAVERDGGVQ